MVAVVKRPEQYLVPGRGKFETLGQKFRNETEGLLPSPPPKTIIKRRKGKIMTKPIISIIMGSKSDWATMQKQQKS